MPVVRNLDGCVIIPARICRVFAPIVRQALEEGHRRDGVRWHPDIWAELAALEEAAAMGQASRVAATTSARQGTLSSATVEGMEELLTAAQAAHVLGVTRQAIHARCRRGTLLHVRDERGRMWINRTDLT